MVQVSWVDAREFCRWLSQKEGKPYRLKIRAPSFIHMGAFDHMARGYMIADVVTIFGTYDIVMGECDR